MIEFVPFERVMNGYLFKGKMTEKYSWKKLECEWECNALIQHLWYYQTAADSGVKLWQCFNPGPDMYSNILSHVKENC